MKEGVRCGKNKQKQSSRECQDDKNFILKKLSFSRKMNREILKFD
jgi:hypothetical protein